MSREAIELLNTLVDKVERQPDRVRRVQERAPEVFGSAGDRDRFNAYLENGESLGAVELVWGKGEARHLLERVILKDLEGLYRFLGRRPAREQAAEAVAALNERAKPVSAEARRAADLIASGWQDQGRPFGFGRDDLERALPFLMVLDAVFLRSPNERSDMRTYSRLKTGHSKNIERHASAIAAFARHEGIAGPELGIDDVLKLLGLEKFPQPVLLSGPVGVRGADLSGLLFAGVAPEDATDVRATRPLTSILTIENLASFNRHVREAKRPDDLVVFTGGFPSRGVMTALVTIAGKADIVHHWGDVDEGGIGIALYLSRNLSVPVLPHLMDAELAAKLGEVPESPVRLPRGETPAPWRPLAEFLAGPDCRVLEQEELEPVAPAGV